MKSTFLRSIFVAATFFVAGGLQTIDAQTCSARDIVTIRGTTVVGPTIDPAILAAVGFAVAPDGTVQFEFSHEYTGPGILTSTGYMRVRSYDAAGNLMTSIEATPASITYNEFNETVNTGFVFDTYRAGGGSTVNGKLWDFGMSLDDTTDRDALPNTPVTYLNNLGLWSQTVGGLGVDMNDDGQVELGYWGPIIQLSATVVPRCSSPTAVASYVNGLPPSSFSSHGQKNAMLARLENIKQKILSGDSAGALQDLENLRRKVDGCGNAADNNDWITDCAAQLQVRTMIDQIITSLGG